jgi:hypothetical protein
MIRTIQGRRFDTDLSVKIGTYHFDPDGSHWWIATLYRTPRSERYFLAGAGGAMSRWRGEEGITELTRKEARAWTKEYLGKRAVREYFEEAA